MANAHIEWVHLKTGDRQLLGAGVPGARVPVASGNVWNGIRLQRMSGPSGEIPEGFLPKHLIAVVKRPVVNEGYWAEAIPRPWTPQRIEPGMMRVFPARRPYAVRWKPVENVMADNVMIEIAPEMLQSVACTHAPGRTELRPSLAQDPFILQAAMCLENDLRASSPAGSVYGETVGAALAAHLVRWHSDGAPRSLDSGRLPGGLLQCVLEFVDNNLETNLSLQDLADRVHLDVYTFARSFKEAVGLPPHRYIISRRIARAKKLLAQRQLSIAEIALRCGFASQSNFATVFHRVVKATPCAYRGFSRSELTKDPG